ncbi:hypothetical protein Anas_12790 [Armadillidium nasatum]|uniref:Uncharacterized protein n=1 Tax=Armadillidium nasatum TaxID=96803 RepID=A0A5N5T5D9_9CRUS|nr:hypothetical protein Anas_12790 [Armadillidium nasatum]
MASNIDEATSILEALEDTIISDLGTSSKSITTEERQELLTKAKADISLTKRARAVIKRKVTLILKAAFEIRYWIGFNELMQNISVFYPSWRVRVYASSPDISFLQSIMKNWTFVNFCDIDNLPPPIYSVRFYPVTMWRFASLGDDQVDVMLSRDLDSEILKREYDAVSEWLNSTNKSLHIMRDHQLHCVTMLGGTWGIRVTKPSERRRLRIIRQEMFKSVFDKTETRDDQIYLTVNFNDNVLDTR